MQPRRRSTSPARFSTSRFRAAGRRFRPAKCLIPPPADRIWLKADLPSSQSAHYLDDHRFSSRSHQSTAGETGFLHARLDRQCATDALPSPCRKGRSRCWCSWRADRGDFKTLMSAVRGRPGAFVRTSQDLNQAELDRAPGKDIYRPLSAQRVDPPRSPRSQRCWPAA